MSRPSTGTDVSRVVTQAMICAAEDRMRQGPQAEFDTEVGLSDDLGWRVSRFKAGTMATSRAHLGGRLLIVLQGSMRVVLGGRVVTLHAGDFTLAGEGKTMIYCDTDVEVMAVHATEGRAVNEEQLEALVIADETLYRQQIGVSPPGLLVKE
jgi:quercetin dioxygenase-like cupin family protein